MQVRFWAKTTVDEQPGISVFEHMENVGYVARGLACIAPDLLRHFQMGAPEVGALAALHDLGKISPGFQQKCRAWLEESGLTEIAQRWGWDATMESDHGKVSHAAVQDFLVSNGATRSAAKFLSAVLGGHHGKLSPPNDRGYQPNRPMSEQHSGIDWPKERNDAAIAICDTFGADLTELVVDHRSPVLWWLAGLTSVADWIGSDEKFFSPENGVPVTKAEAICEQAITAIGLVAPVVEPGLSFHDLFHENQRPNIQFVPNEMQSRAHSTITSPGVYVIEAPMGTGKTEAALWAAYQLLADKRARGTISPCRPRRPATECTAVWRRSYDALRPRLWVAGSSMAIHGSWSRNSVSLRQQVESAPQEMTLELDAIGSHRRNARCWLRLVWVRLTRHCSALSPRNTSLCGAMPWPGKS